MHKTGTEHIRVECLLQIHIGEVHTFRQVQLNKGVADIATSFNLRKATINQCEEHKYTNEFMKCERRIRRYLQAGASDFVIRLRVLIPIRGIKEVNESQNVNKAEQKYLEIVTEDYSEFWFVGFLRYDKALKHLNKAISMANKVTQAETHTNKSLAKRVDTSFVQLTAAVGSFVVQHLH
ncbi:GEM-like protein 4 [Glycine soja]|uniref:GEM-like protein 4 n=1 Tax=Glycine soja TaxID=3848 RepID=A0A445IZF9_GLYSO|nr:GEM-like protein 4 [Glycine soja]